MPNYTNSPVSYLYDAARQLRNAARGIDKAAKLLEVDPTDGRAKQLFSQALSNMAAAEVRIRSHAPQPPAAAEKEPTA